MSTQKNKHHGDGSVSHGAKASHVNEGSESAGRPAETLSANLEVEAPLSQEDQAGQSGGCQEAGQDQSRELVTVKTELLAAREELASLNDKYLRKLADEVNFRKRMARDKEDTRRFAINAFLGDIVPILDDFDRALTGSNSTTEVDHLREGVILIRRQLGQMLENKYGLKRMVSVDQPFDPNSHEAVNMEMGDTEEPVVCEEYLPGYVVEERVVRTAKVKVRMPAPKPAVEAATATVASGPENGTEGPAGLASGDFPDVAGAGPETGPDSASRP